MTQGYIGGSFAPPLPVEKLAEYRKAIEANAPADLKDSLLGLCTMVETFQATPESSQPKAKHPVGKGYIQKLDDAEIKRIWDLVPWDWECEALQERARQMPATDADRDNTRRNREYKAHGEVMPQNEWIVTARMAANHLVWFAKELTKDREPCTNDKL